MFFVSVITLVFVLTSIYFFFRAEKLQRKLITQQRESSSTRKENKMLVETMTLVATREQEFA
jgi:Na+/H+ antiporter NhaD/arsenite permease-like protein